MQTVLEVNLGKIEVECPWCIHKYPFFAEVIVSEERIPEMFGRIKAGYERVLYLHHYNAKRVDELTRLEQQLVRDRLEANAVRAKIPVYRPSSVRAIQSQLLAEVTIVRPSALASRWTVTPVSCPI